MTITEALKHTGMYVSGKTSCPETAGSLDRLHRCLLRVHRLRRIEVEYHAQTRSLGMPYRKAFGLLRALVRGEKVRGEHCVALILSRYDAAGALLEVKRAIVPARGWKREV